MADDEQSWIAANLAFYRRVCGCTQHQLASRLGVTAQLISRYEQGLCEIPVAELYNISRILAVPVEDFFLEPPKMDGRHKNRQSARAIGDALAGLDSLAIRAAIAHLVDRAIELQDARQER